MNVECDVMLLICEGSHLLCQGYHPATVGDTSHSTLLTFPSIDCSSTSHHPSTLTAQLTSFCCLNESRDDDQVKYY